MAIKRTWTAVVGHIRSRPVHRWSHSGGYEGIAPRVSVMVRVSSGRERGRFVEVLLTPEEAERRAVELLEAAQRTRESGLVERTELG